MLEFRICLDLYVLLGCYVLAGTASIPHAHTETVKCLNFGFVWIFTFCYVLAGTASIPHAHTETVKCFNFGFVWIFTFFTFQYFFLNFFIFADVLALLAPTMQETKCRGARDTERLILTRQGFLRTLQPQRCKQIRLSLYLLPSASEKPEPDEGDEVGPLLPAKKSPSSLQSASFTVDLLNGET